jgi:alpha-ribazole phosphatase
VKLWLVRHAQPLLAAGVCYGALDVPADPQASALAAQALAGVVPAGLRVLSSPLQRCQALARALQDLRPDLVLATDTRLVEMDFGLHEGRRWDSIEAGAYDDWMLDFWQHRFGGAESLAEVMARVASAWDEAAHSGLDHLWICHAGVIRAATLLDQGLRRIDQMSQWPANAPGFGQWLVLEPGRVVKN